MRPGQKAVVLDTNFFLLPARHKVDVFGLLEGEGYGIVLLDAVSRELEGLSNGQSETAFAARLALQLIKRKGLNTVPSSEGYADDAVLAYCRAHHAAAATQDGALRRVLRSAGVPVVTYHRSGKLTTEEQ